jgi:uncharacterized membrane protein
LFSLIMHMIFPILAVFGLPFLVSKFESKFKLIEWLSPVVCCYGLGIVLGNLPGISWDPKLARTLSEVSIMLSLPMLLLATDFPAWFKLAKQTILSFVVLILCVMLVSYIFGKAFASYDPEVWKMAGMLVGVYVGGTANLTAIGKILEIRDDAFITLNAVDVALGGIYLLIIMSVGVKILTKIFKPFDHSLVPEDSRDLLNWKKLSLSKKTLHSLILIIGCLTAVGISLGLSKLLTGGESAGVIILILTVIALGLSFIHKIRHFEGSQEVGHFFLLVFCVAVGSLANVNELLTGKAWYFAFASCVMFGSIFLHFLCCYFLKIDRDTAIITSMAGIFGPAFIPPMSDVLKNRAILVSGITTGLVGIAVGNFAGLLVSWLLN